MWNCLDTYNGCWYEQIIEPEAVSPSSVIYPDSVQDEGNCVKDCSCDNEILGFWNIWRQALRWYGFSRGIWHLQWYQRYYELKGIWRYTDISQNLNDTWPCSFSVIKRITSPFFLLRSNLLSSYGILSIALGSCLPRKRSELNILAPEKSLADPICYSAFNLWLTRSIAELPLVDALDVRLFPNLHVSSCSYPCHLMAISRFEEAFGLSLVKSISNIFQCRSCHRKFIIRI